MFILYFDHNYYKWAHLMIESIGIHEPKERIFLWTFNLSKELYQYLESYDNVIGGVTTKILKNDMTVFQIICSRGGIVLDVMEKFPDEDHYIITDVDMIMVNPLHEFKKLMPEYDMAVVKAEMAEKFCGGFIAFRKTKSTIYFLTKFNNMCMSGDFYYNKDQPILTKLVRKFQEQMKFLFLSRMYMDQFSREKAFLWSAHKKEISSKEQRYMEYSIKLKEMKNGLENRRKAKL